MRGPNITFLCKNTERHIRGGIEDNSKIVFIIPQ